MWSDGERPSPRTDLRKRGTQYSTSSQRRLPPKSDPFQKCSMCSNNICGFLQHSGTSSARSVVLSCAHVVCDDCFEKLGSTSSQTENHEYVKCVLCRSTVTYTLLPTLDDIIPLTLCFKCAEEHSRLSHCIKKESSPRVHLPLKYVQCWNHLRRFDGRCKLCDQLLCSECPLNSNKENGCEEHRKASLSSSDFGLEDSMLFAERIQEEIAIAMNSAVGFRDELCARANLLKNEICAHIYYMMNALPIIGRDKQEKKPPTKQLDEVVSRCNHAQRHLDTACELDEKARDINLLKDSDSADFYKCLSYQLFRPVFALLGENQKCIPNSADSLELRVGNVNTQEIINKVGSWGSNITSTCHDLGSEAISRTIRKLRPDEAWDAKTPPPTIGCYAALDLHVTPREVPLFFLSAFNNLWMKFILNACKPDHFTLLKPGECDPVPPCSETYSSSNRSPLEQREEHCFPSSSEKNPSATVSPRVKRLPNGIVVHRILALNSGMSVFRSAGDVLLTCEDLFCIGHRLCSKRDVRIKRVHLLRMVANVLERIDSDLNFCSKISYDEYPTDYWDATDMRDVEEIFDALCATAHFQGWSYTKLMPMAMVLYAANFYFNDFSKFFAVPSDVINSRKRNSESDGYDLHHENGSSYPAAIKRGLSYNEQSDEHASQSPCSYSNRSVAADEKDSSDRRERERLIVKIRRCGATPSVSHIEVAPPSHEEDDSVAESDAGVRPLDKDGSHAFCWKCNDNTENAEEVKGMCSKCPRVFHAKCHIPPVAGSWDDTPDDWVCSICERVYDDGSPSSTLKLCYKVLLCCYEHAECASCFAQPVPANTPGYYKVIEHPMDLGTIAVQLQTTNLTNVMPVSEFIEKMNTVFRNCSKFNPKNSPVAEAGRKVWQSYQSAVKKYLPSYTKDIWLYVSLHDRKKRRKRSLSKGDHKSSRLSLV
ncbi:Bromodomain protein [Ostertagia ostertagi]